MTYSGWKNYETWVVNLWINNDPDSQSYWEMVARKAWNASENVALFTRSEAARYSLGQRLKKEINEESPLRGKSSLYDDLLYAALSDVHWNEIADGFLDALDLEEYQPTKALQE